MNRAVPRMYNDLKFFVNAVLLVLMCMSASVTAQAGNTRDRGFEALLNSADLVVYGHFSSVTSEWRGNKIFTLGVFHIDRVYKGEHQNSVIVEYLGGTAIHPRLGAPVTMNSSESVSFKQGEEAILLLQHKSNDVYQIIGLNRGKIPVVTQADGSKQLQGFSRIQAQGSQDDASRTIDGRPMTLNEFAGYAASFIRGEGVQ